MPPKKAKQTIQSVFLQSIEQLELECPEQLSTPLVQSAYGLTSNAPPRTTIGFDCHANQGRTSPQPKPVATASSDVITLSSSDEDIQTSTPLPTRSPRPALKTYKSKPKPTKSTTTCSADNCRSNPFCTKWLGQDSWENSGQSPRLSSRVGKVTTQPHHNSG